MTQEIKDALESAERALLQVVDLNAVFQALTKKERLAVKALIKIQKLLRP